ncbi:hypothetical protein Pcinc_033714 [Petrolisthes cinctipes]|uniref:Uncharacterized protein n=1 Tax=Petrolisthes cinctipes TaxID=88211 RepID=A0AAE1ERR4_PETCI|nr:hypothetical protein Pcinc_033714 [Petrolisthes cinctipes]
MVKKPKTKIIKSNKRHGNVSGDELVTVRSDLILLAREWEEGGEGGLPKFPEEEEEEDGGKYRRYLQPQSGLHHQSGGVECKVRKKKKRRREEDGGDSGERGGVCGGDGGVLRVVEWLSKMAVLLLLLYLFVCSLNLLASAFRLVGGRTASAVFRQSQVLSNPVVGLMIGVVVTSLVQSSSTSSSIIVSMVAAEFLEVRTAVPIVMGANIGTSLTNTLVSLGQVANRQQFERSFSGAVVHDMFNWLCVLVLLPLEVATGYLYHLTNFILSSDLNLGHESFNLQLLSAVTKPLTEMIVKLDKSVLMGWSLGDPSYENSTLLLRQCPFTIPLPPFEFSEQFLPNVTIDQEDSTRLNTNTTTTTTETFTLFNNNNNTNNNNGTFGVVDAAKSFINTSSAFSLFPVNGGGDTFDLGNGTLSTSTTNNNKDFYYTSAADVDAGNFSTTTVFVTCQTVTAVLPLSDLGVGLVLLAASLVLLSLCLVAIVRTLSSLLKGSVASLVQRILNADLPGVPWLTGYLAILAGAALTFLLQSSSIFTSTLTPLVGLGMISVERVYPLTLGSNLGTTTTALLAALASDSGSLRPAIQIALIHLFFNLTGLLLWYPVPFLRFPISLALSLGKVTAEYRWFAIVYILLTFCVVPLIVFSVSLAGPIAMYSVFIPVVVVSVFVFVVNVMQSRCPRFLPSILRTWLWLPLPLRSLKPYDNILSHLMCCVSQGINSSSSSINKNNHVYAYVSPTTAPTTVTEADNQEEVTAIPSEQVVVVVEDEMGCMMNGCCGGVGGGGDSGRDGGNSAGFCESACNEGINITKPVDRKFSDLIYQESSNNPVEIGNNYCGDGNDGGGGGGGSGGVYGGNGGVTGSGSSGSVVGSSGSGGSVGGGGGLGGTIEEVQISRPKPRPLIQHVTST